MNEQPNFGVSVIVYQNNIDFAIRTFEQHRDTIRSFTDNENDIVEEWHSLSELGLKILYEDKS